MVFQVLLSDCSIEIYMRILGEAAKESRTSLLPMEKPVASHLGCVLTLLHFLRQNIYLVVKKTHSEPIYVLQGLLCRSSVRSFLITQDRPCEEEVQISHSPRSHSLHSQRSEFSQRLSTMCTHTRGMSPHGKQ